MINIFYLIYILLGCLVLYFSPLIISALQKRRLRKLCQEKRCLVLTFDDGPGLGLTPRLLKLLKKLEVRANFFVLCEKAENNKDLIGLLGKMNHEVGYHSCYHLHAWKVGPFRLLNDLNKGLKISASFLTEPLFFRPPYGKLVLSSFLWSMKHHFKLAWWTLDSGDTYADIPESIQDLVDKLILDGGGVVLLHDFDRTFDMKFREDYVLNAVEALVKAARENNIKILTLSTVYE